MQRLTEQPETDQAGPAPALEGSDDRQPQYAGTGPGRLQHDAEHVAHDPQHRFTADRMRRLVRGQARTIEHRALLRPLLSQLADLEGRDDLDEVQQTDLELRRTVLNIAVAQIAQGDPMEHLERPRQFEADMIVIRFGQLTGRVGRADIQNILGEIDRLLDQLTDTSGLPISTRLIDAMVRDLRVSRERHSRG